MARDEFSIKALCLILVLAYGTLQCVQGAESIQGLGINWGALASHPMDANIVANMLKDNGIKKVKLFDADPKIVGAFSGSNIEVMVGIPNDQLSKFAKSSGDAEDWVKKNLTKHFHSGGVNIRYVAVGNEPFLKNYGDKFVKTTFPAMQNIQKAIDKAGYGDKVKVTTALNADVYESKSNKPSDGEFRDNIRDVIKQILQLLHERNSPFLVNIYPFLSLYQSEGFPEDFAFFGTQSMTITDKGAEYSNVFDANLDTLAWALKKAGYTDIKIVVGEIGWPTDGNVFGNVTTAKRFYQGFLKNMASNKGTPMLPGHMDAYLFSLFDENLKSIEPGNFERHWGIFRHDGKPKFPIDFSGKGEEKWPQGAKGVRYQERKWCVVSPEVKNLTLIPGALDYACAGADCTSIGYGCSCGNLNLVGNASFAFNQFFQTRDQSVEACDFNGMGAIVTQDPSNGTCLFYIEIESSGGDMLTTMRIMASLLIGLSIFFITLL